jgi:hypothetical protein
MEHWINECLRLGRTKGFLTYEEVNKYLPEDEIDGAKLNEFLLLLEEESIELQDDEMPRSAKSSPLGSLTYSEALFPIRASDVPLDSGPKGWLYVLSNYAMPAYVKLGYSCTNLGDRICRLQSQTANPGLFVLELYYVVESVEQHERNVFEILDRFRIYKRREFFVCSPELAYYKLKAYFGREPDWIHPRLAEALQPNPNGLV